MARAGQRASPWWGFLILPLLLAGGDAVAENIDPGNEGSQYAWGENVGWINAEPSGNGGPGMNVTDFELTGWMWGENVGWISLSCKNESTCGTTNYGVLNDGRGELTGYAWSENVGWINFKPMQPGVLIDPATGDFTGSAWGENVGWIAFSSGGAHPFQVSTAWTCNPAPPPPSGTPSITLGKSGASTTISWGALAGATGYDVVKGGLLTLRNTGGSFGPSTHECLSNSQPETSMSTAASPLVGEGFWYVVRGDNCGGKGTYDSGAPSQVGSRDAEIESSGQNCP